MYIYRSTQPTYLFSSSRYKKNTRKLLQENDNIMIFLNFESCRYTISCSLPQTRTIYPTYTQDRLLLRFCNGRRGQSGFSPKC